MGDSDKSASELRKLYHRGGTLSDDQLSAQQVRARYSIPSNSKRKEGGEETSQVQGFLILSVSVAVVAIIVAYVMGYITK